MDARERRRLIRKRVRRRRWGVIAVSLFVIGLSICFVSSIKAAKTEAKEEKAKKEAQIAKEEAKEAAIKVRQEEHKKKAKEKEELMNKLQAEVEKMVSGFAGDWSVYIQEMDHGNEIILNNEAMYPASLAKLFVMAATYENLDEIVENQIEYYGSAKKAWKEVKTLLEEMIEVSDNEAYNELIKIQSPNRNFAKGAAKVNDYLKENGYEETGIHTTLHPAYSKFEKDGKGDNVTTVKDCGKLLEKIYTGNCVSHEKSGSMLHLLLNQENTIKIPQGLPEGTKVANKTGETSEVQHDAAIVYGESTDFILCIMTKDTNGAEAVYEDIHKLSKLVYDTLNP